MPPFTQDCPIWRDPPRQCDTALRAHEPIRPWNMTKHGFSHCGGRFQYTCFFTATLLLQPPDTTRHEHSLAPVDIGWHERCCLQPLRCINKVTTVAASQCFTWYYLEPELELVPPEAPEAPELGLEEPAAPGLPEELDVPPVPDAPEDESAPRRSQPATAKLITAAAINRTFEGENFSFMVFLS